MMGDLAAQDTYDVDPMTGAVMNPTPRAQGKFGRVVEGIGAGLRDWAMLPGRAYKEGLTPEEEVAWAAPTAMGMVGASRLPGGAPPGSLGAAGGGKLIQPDVMGGVAELGDPLWHGISKVKLERPVAEMSAAREAMPVNERVISPEALQGGVLMPAVGDRSMASARLTGIGDKPLASPVDLQGGHGFMAANADTGHVWASDKGVISTIANRAKRIAEQEGAPVYLPYTAMGERSVDFSHHVSDTLAEMAKGAKILKRSSDPAKGSAASFDAAMRTERGVEDFPGIKDPGLRAYLVDASGDVRNKFAKLMDSRKYQDAGFPSVAEARFAVTDPRLLHEPTGAAGLSISKVDPEKIAPSSHRTYSTALGGSYLGGLGRSVPKEVMYPDIMSAYAQQGYAPVQFDYLMGKGRAPVFQRTDQRWLDNIMRHLEETRQ